MEDDPNKSTNDIPSVHLQLEGLQIVTNNADFSHIMNLPIDVSYALLKQMDFMSYVNLALTCHKWFDIASTAPRSIKPILSIKSLRWRDGTFKEDSECSDPLNSKKCLRWTEDNSYKLVQRIESIDLHVHDDLTSTFCEYLLQHRDVYLISRVYLAVYSRILDLVYDNSVEHSLFSMFECIDLYIATHCRPFTNPLIYNGQLLPGVRCMCQVNAHYCKKIVEDLYNGKFPKLKFFNCDFYMLHNIHNIRKRIVSTVGEFERSYAASHECEMDQFTCLDSRRFVFELQLETAREDEWSLTLTDSNGGDPYD